MMQAAIKTADELLLMSKRAASSYLTGSILDARRDLPHLDG
jgi:hypothetical protein